MNLFRRRPIRPAPPPPAPAPSFGEWLLRQFAAGEPTDTMTFARLERVCSNAGQLLCGAVFARPEAFRDTIHDSRPLLREGEVVARRTADGFRASLADRTDTVLAWPWDHMATAIAWTATRDGDLSEPALGTALTGLGAAYSLAHREQLAAVVDLWQQVAAGLNQQGGPPDLRLMGRDMLDAYESGPALASPG